MSLAALGVISCDWFFGRLFLVDSGQEQELHRPSGIESAMV